MALWLVACGENPEQLLVGRWQELDWDYEKFDGYDPERVKWIDGVRLPLYTNRDLVRHEAEYWEFQPGQALVISKRDGSKLSLRWRLKGRGHVLTVRSDPRDSVELYDVKELDRNTLILNYDIGMEVRGIAKLTFRRVNESAQERDKLALLRGPLGKVRQQ